MLFFKYRHLLYCMSEFKLFKEIVKRSVASSWREAVKEWKLLRIEYSSIPQSCMCGHRPINELCFIINTKNDNRVLVGNCCVKKFFGMDVGKVFTAIAKGKVNKQVIDYCFDKKIINDWEARFMDDVWRKRSLSPKQHMKREQIVGRIMRRLTR